AQAMASAAAALVRAASGAADAIEGTVRITASDVVGAEVLPAIVRDLRIAHPKLSFELVLSNQSSDLLRRDADIAIRMVRPQQSALIAKKTGPVLLGAYAHRDYLKRRGTPRTMAEFSQHDLIGYDRVIFPMDELRAVGLDLRRETLAFRTDND